MKRENNLERITLEHGSGGALSRQLTEELIFPLFRGADYPRLDDASPFRVEGKAFLTTDSYVVDPPFFPGGDIGRLAVFGTCNDLAVCGARPRFLSLGLVAEEGLPIAELARVLSSVKEAAAEAGVRVITGDTKVVPAGKGGGIYLNTAGVGEAVFPHPLSTGRLRPGDLVLVSGPIGTHGLTVLAAREGLAVVSGLASDCANLYPLCARLYDLGEDLRFLRDATRGGVASVLNEMISASSLGLEAQESSFPVDKKVAAAADLLGLSLLEVANEGVLVAAVAPGAGGRALEQMRSTPLGRKAAVVGKLTGDHPGRVILETAVGGRRLLDFPRGLLLPRIC